MKLILNLAIISILFGCNQSSNCNDQIHFSGVSGYTDDAQSYYGSPTICVELTLYNENDNKDLILDCDSLLFFMHANERKYLRSNPPSDSWQTVQPNTFKGVCLFIHAQHGLELVELKSIIEKQDLFTDNKGILEKICFKKSPPVEIDKEH